MSFTEDELQSFNTILEQRLQAHRREMERVFDQRMNEYRRDLDQRLVNVQQDTLRTLSQKLSEFQGRLETVLSEKLNTQQTHITQTISHDVKESQQQLEGSVDRMLAAQLLGIEQLLNQELTLQLVDEASVRTGVGAPAQLEAIEVQTELPWEDLMEVIGKALDERLSTLNEATQRSLKNLEQYLSVRLHSLRDEFMRSRGQQTTYDGGITSIQEVLHSIEHLERIIESMQVAMTANHALLSNRLYHHQQLPLERAHPGGHIHAVPNNNANTQFSIARERVAAGLEPGMIARQTEIEEQKM
jgi:hypothetical protein